jgi:hypothetical protein
MAMTTTLTHFACRIDMWNANGENIIEDGLKEKPPVLKPEA